MTSDQTPTLAITPDQLQRFYGWTNVGLLFFIQFAVSGFVYLSYSVIFPEMIEMTGWDRGAASIGHSIALLCFGVFYPLTAWMIGRYGVRATLYAGMCVMMVGLALIVMVVDAIWQWNLVWGLVLGLSFALTGPICAQTLMINWFNARRATTIGIVLTGSAVGAVLAQPLLAYIMESYASWRAGWMTSAIMVVLAIITARFIINHPLDRGQFPDGIDPNRQSASDIAPGPRTYRTTHDWSLREVFRNPTIYMQMLVSAGYLLVLTFLLSHGALHLRDGGISEIEAASILGLVFLGSVLGRMPAGWLGDLLPLRWVIVCFLAAMIGSFCVFWISTEFLALSIAGLVFGAGYGSMLVLLPALIGNYYGEKAFPAVNSVIAPVMLPFAAAAPVGAGYIFENTGSYDLAFIIGLAMLGVAMIGATFLVPPKTPIHPA